MSTCSAGEFAPLLAAASAVGPLQFVPARHEATAWQQCLAQFAEQPVGYARSHVDYQHAYFASVCPEYAPLDCLIRWQGKTIGVWPLAWVGSPAGEARLSSHLNGQNGVVAPLLAADLPEKTRKAAARQWLALLGRSAQALSCPTIRLNADRPATVIADWQRLAMESGASLQAKHRAQIDLGLGAEEYHKRLRKSYKALINEAGRHWQLNIDDRGDLSAFRGFEALHIAVAGRRTRSEESWQAQFSAIANGEAFAVYLHDTAGQLVGASLFNRSRDEVLYAVGAYDRQLFDKPLAHLSLYAAIGHARELGARRFILGDRPYPGETPPPAAKDLQIAFFKEGFATELVLMPYLTANPDALCQLAKI